MIIETEQAELIRQLQQRPLLELSAQFGSIKCLICPKQINLLTEMVTRLNEYIEAANSNIQTLKLNQKLRPRKNHNKLIRGCDKREYHTMMKNEQSGALTDDENENFKSFVNHGDNEESVMFYSMTPESSAGHLRPSKLDASLFDDYGTSNSDANQREMNDGEDKVHALISKELKQTIEQLQNDVIVSNIPKTGLQSNNIRHNLFQTFKVHNY